MFLKVPQRQRVEQTLDGQREIQITVGNKVWVRRVDGRVVELPAVEPLRTLPTVLVPVKRRAEELLAEWRARGVRTDVSHAARVGTRTVTVIGARPGDRDIPAVWLDPDFGVVRLVTRERLPNGAKLVDLTLSEHRPLAGRLYFPYRQEMFVDGKLLMLFAVRSIAINTHPADSLFLPATLKVRGCTPRFSAPPARSRRPYATPRRSSSPRPRAPCYSTAAEARSRSSGASASTRWRWSRW